MKKEFEFIENELGNYVKMTDENGIIWSIPCDPANSDYQAYLKSLNEPASKS